MKKLLLALGIFFLLLLGLLIALPILYKDEIVAQIKTEANNNLNAKLDFADVDVSVFRHFPKLTVGLKGLDITGVGEFEGTRLLRCENLDVAVDLWSALFGSELIINGLHLYRPNIHVYVLKNGKANYDIAKPSAEPAAPAAQTESSGAMKLEDYTINDGTIVYEDRAGDMLVEMYALNHKGRGDFGTVLYDIDMDTRVGRMSVNSGGVQYLRNANLHWVTTLGADMANTKYTLKDNSLKINDLEVNLEGWVQMPNETDMLMDLKFGTPQNTFKSLLSIVPGAYTKDFDGVAANGTVQFGGFAKGKYNEKTYPAFGLQFKVGNGDFKYPSLPLGVSGINVDANINSPSSNLNDMTVSIPKFALRIGSNPLEGHFNLKTPVSDPNVDTKIAGTLNLGELTKAFPVEGVQELSGIFKADILMKAAMSQIERQAYEQVQMSGSLSMSGINYRAAGTPPVKINNLAMNFSPQFVEVQQFDSKLGVSDLRASGRIDNILAWFSTEKTMTGNLTVNSGYFDANEWMTPTPEEAAQIEAVGKVPTDAAPAPTEKAFDRWDFTVDGNMRRVKYDVYDLSDVTAKGHFTPNKMDINSFGLKIGQSDLAGDGQILNAWNYLFDNQTVKGKINLRSSFFDLNQFMTEEPAKTGASGASTAAAAPAAEAVIPVPENMDMTLNANFAKVQYTNLTLENLDGAIVVKDKVASLKDCTASVLGGQVGLTGEYNTQDLAKPAFNMDMALQNMGFRDAYTNFVTVKSFAPVAQLMDGKFNTTLSMAGILGKDMMPDLNSLSAAGFLETINAVINNFKPAQAIGEKLNVDYLKRMELGSTKNWFEIKDGQVFLKPVNFNVKEIAMKIEGSHGLSSEMNYQFTTKTPRKLLEKNAVGAAASSGLNLLTSEASKYGVNIKQGEFVNVRFDLTGSLFNPKIAMKVLGSDGESTLKDEASSAAGAAVEKAKDSLATVANKELDKAKEKAKAAADRARDSLQRLADKKIEEAKNQATDKVKEEAGKVLGKEVGDKVGEKVGDKVGQKAGEVLGDKGQKTVDEAKKKLDKWDPFKKKKDN